MKQWWGFFICLVFISLVSAETVSPGVLVPRDVYVGDTAVVTFTVKVPNTVLNTGSEFNLPKEDIPSVKTARIDDVQVRYGHGDAEIRIEFVPWKAGSLELPPIIVDGSTIVPPAVTIASLLDRDGITTPAPPRPPLLIPGTTYMIYGGIVAVFFIVGILWFLSAKLRAWLVSSPARRRAGRRVKFISREIAILSRRHRMDRAQWFARLSLSVKRYLGLYFSGRDDAYIAATGKELSQRATVEAEFLTTAEFSAAEKWAHASQLIRDLYTEIDRTRFGGLDAHLSREDLLEVVRDLSITLEGMKS